MIYLIVNQKSSCRRSQGEYTRWRNENGIIKVLTIFNSFRMGIGNLLDVMEEHEFESRGTNENEENDNEDYDKKSDTAEDFSDINELAEDVQTAMQVFFGNLKDFFHAERIGALKLNKFFCSQISNPLKRLTTMMILKPRFLHQL